MNLFNRFVLILFCLALAAGAIAVAILAWSMPNDSIAGLQDGVDWLTDHNTDGTKAIITAVAAGIATVSLIVLIFELMPKSPTHVKVVDLKVGDAVLSTAAIGQRVEEAVSAVPHVADARATIKARRNGVQVSLDLHVDPEANLATVTDEACSAAQDVLTNKVHVALAEPPRARLHYRELRLRGREIRTVPIAPRTVLQPVHAVPGSGSVSAPVESKAPESTVEPTSEESEEKKGE